MAPAHIVTKKVAPEADPNAPLPPEQEKMRQRDNQMVKGIFIDKECKGGTLNVPFLKWKGDQVRQYKLTDGLEAEIPRGLADYINNNCYVEKHSFLQMPDGTPMKNPVKEKRFAFMSKEFS